MPLYRLHRKLDIGDEILQPGLLSINGTLGDTSVIPAIRLKSKSVDKLVEKGAISRLGAPPLGVLAGWAKRAVKLEAHGITTVEQFVEGDVDQIAAIFNVKAVTVRGWKEELLTWLVVSNRPPALVAGCG